MPKRVLSVGQCGPDNFILKGFLNRHFQVEFDTADHAEVALAKLRHGVYDLVLVNRKLDADYSSGVEVIEDIKRDGELAHVPIMLITNYEDSQRDAVENGAEYGFGKLELEKPETIDRLRRFL